MVKDLYALNKHMVQINSIRLENANEVIINNDDKFGSFSRLAIAVYLGYMEQMMTYSMDIKLLDLTNSNEVVLYKRTNKYTSKHYSSNYALLSHVVSDNTWHGKSIIFMMILALTACDITVVTDNIDNNEWSEYVHYNPCRSNIINGIYTVMLVIQAIYRVRGEELVFLAFMNMIRTFSHLLSHTKKKVT